MPQAQMASLVLKPMIPNLDLIHDLVAASTSPRNIIFISQSVLCLNLSELRLMNKLVKRVSL